VEGKINTRKRGLRVLIVVGVLVVLGLAAYILVSSVDVVALLRQMHGG
jgi:hypothetical protein